MPSSASSPEDEKKKERFWNGARADGDWTVPENWGGEKPPTSDCDVYLYKASKKQGEVPRTPGVNNTVKSLALDMSRTKDNPVSVIPDDWEGLGVAGEGLTVAKRFHWRFGYIEADIRLTAATEVRIDNPPIGILDGPDSTPSIREMLLLDKVPAKRLHRPLKILGSCEVENTHLTLQGEGLLTFSGNVSVTGTSRFSGGMASTCGLHVDGTMTVRSGTLYIDDVALVLRGRLTIAKGATVVLGAKTAAHCIGSSAKVDGPGTLILAGRLVVTTGGKISRSTPVVLDSGTIENLRGAQLSSAVIGEVTSQRFTVSGPMEWKSGTVKGDIVVEKTGSMLLHTDDEKRYTSGSLLNRGTVEIHGSHIDVVDGMLDNRGTLNLADDVDISTGREFYLSNKGTVTVAGPGRSVMGHFPFVNAGRLNVGTEDGDVAELHLRHWGGSVFTQTKTGVLFISPGSTLRSDAPLSIEEGMIGGVDPKIIDDPLELAGHPSAVPDATIIVGSLTLGRSIQPGKPSPPMTIIPGGSVVPGALVVQGSCMLKDSAILMLRDYAPAGGDTACLKIAKTGTMRGTLVIKMAGIPASDYVSSVIIGANPLGGVFTLSRYPRFGDNKVLPRVTGNDVRVCVEHGPGIAVSLLHAGSQEFVGEALADDEPFRATKGECATGVQYVMARAFRPVGEVATWKPGIQVRGADVPPGTVIGSFQEGGVFKDTHAAILIRQTDRYLEVWDQYRNRRSVTDPYKEWGVRQLWYNDSSDHPHGNDGDYFYVVERR